MRDLELPDEMSGLQSFRRRWRQAVSTSDPIQDSIENLNDCAEHSNSLDTALDAVSALEESDPNGLLDIPLDSVSAPEVFDVDDDDEPPFSLVDDVISKDDTPPHTLMVATAKSKPQPVVDTFVSNPQGINRTTDELSARVLHERMSKMKQPWQQGPLSSLFSQPKNIWQRDTTVHCIGMYDHLSIDDGTSVKPKAASSSVLGKQRIRTARMINDEDDFRRVALGRFKTMILVDLNSTRLGKSLQTFAGTLCANDELSQIFSDVFSPKATGTIIKRCNAMWRFYHWLQCRGGGSPFCQTENTLYEYISQLRVHAGPTAPSQFVESFRFCDGLFGLDKVPVDLALSSRVVGAAHSSFMTKRIRRPAELLTVSEITELERLCFDGEPNHIRVISGHLFFSFMAGARWHDTMYIVSTEVSENRGMFLMEASTERHKSSRGKEQQMELLPFTALGQAMHEEPWVKPWNEARHLEGCVGWNHFLRSWSESRSVWSLGKMSTAEATCWLRELLEPVSGKQRADKLTVHGLKATLCSWAAKSLMFSPDEQLALGHHVHPQYKSAMIYSRDNQIRLCTKLYFMFRKLREGGFHPDRPRVERLFELTQNVAMEQEADEASSQSGTSSDSDVASSHAESVDQDSLRVLPRLQSEDVESHHCRIHRKSRVIHLLSADMERFQCGRRVSSNHKELAVADINSAEAVVCADCSKSHKCGI